MLAENPLPNCAVYAMTSLPPSPVSEFGVKPRYPSAACEKKSKNDCARPKVKPAHWMKARFASNWFSRVVATVRVGAQTDSDVAAHRAVFSLVAGISGDIAADTPPGVAGAAVILVVNVGSRRKNCSCSKLPQPGPNRRS